MRNLLSLVLCLVAIPALWQLLVSCGLFPAYLLPAPASVAEYLARGLAENGELWPALGQTLQRLLYGYLLGVIPGILLGLAAARLPIAGKLIGTLSLGFQALPSICWVPLACIWFGQEESAILFVVVMGTLWGVILATGHGIRSVPDIYPRAALTMGAGRWDTLFNVILPASSPYLISGLKQGWAFAWRSLMTAEVSISVIGGFGIGQTLYYGRELNNMSQVIGIMLLIIIIGLLCDKLLFSPAERYIHRCWGTNNR